MLLYLCIIFEFFSLVFCYFFLADFECGPQDCKTVVTLFHYKSEEKKNRRIERKIHRYMYRYIKVTSPLFYTPIILHCPRLTVFFLCFPSFILFVGSKNCYLHFLCVYVCLYVCNCIILLRVDVEGE